MDGPSENVREIPKINWADYINNLEVLDMQADPHRNTNGETMTADYYGEIEGWEDPAHTFLHDIITVRMGLRLYTKAAMHDPSFQARRFLDSPEAVEYYQVYVSVNKLQDTFYINSNDPDLAREIHKAFYDHLSEKEPMEQTFQWLRYGSKFAGLKSPLYPSLPLIDVLPPNARKKILEMK